MMELEPGKKHPKRMVDYVEFMPLPRRTPAQKREMEAALAAKVMYEANREVAARLLSKQEAPRNRRKGVHTLDQRTKQLVSDAKCYAAVEDFIKKEKLTLNGAAKKAGVLLNLSQSAVKKAHARMQTHYQRGELIPV
jgi:hypothetical protein